MESQKQSVIDNLTSGERWLRLGFMVILAIASRIGAMLVMIIALLQAIIGFVMGEPNGRLQHFSASLSDYLHQVYDFLTYNSDVKPFPFSDWPKSPSVQEPSDS